MRYFTRVGGVEREYRFERRGGRLFVSTGGREHELDVSALCGGTAFSLLVDGASHDLVVERADGAAVVLLHGERVEVQVLDERSRAAADVRRTTPGGVELLRAVMPGVIADVLVAEGDAVEAGQTLVVLEAMKMQNPVRAEGGGVVKRVLAAKGVAVAGGDLLVEIEGA